MTLTKFVLFTPARCGVWKRPTASFLVSRGHLNRGFFYILNNHYGKENNNPQRNSRGKNRA